MKNEYICPLGRKNCTTPHAIAVDGGLRHLEGGLNFNDVQRLGWTRVDYPKRSYYFEFDKTHPSYKEKEQIELDDNSEILTVEVI